MPQTLTLVCADPACGAENAVMAPADDSWEAVVERDQSAGPAKEHVVTGYRITVRCPDCGARSQYTRDPAAGQ